ncbi:hypothetical protein BCR43DRAFT_46463 [Syncephalastrum racemosum]|uniref:Uncharacterized protein n=1 Tax=Syncephalastrum racemosum TaxID=13706 RepID=A0A1X2HUT9_SYNRA|nr:hypothetical protein BCR43DRAFT_46463 [Syncephalastrum racemosum]
MMVHQKSNNGSDGTSVAGNTNPNPHFVSQEQNTNVSFYSEHNHSTLGGALSSSLLARPTQPKKTAMVNLTCPSTLFRADTGNRAWQTSITPTASTTEAEEPVVLSTVRTDTALLLPGTSTNSAYHATASLSSSSSSSSSAASSASHYRNASTSNCTSYAIMHSPIEMHVDYSALRKAFSKFQSKTKQRHDIAQQQVLPWFHKQPPCLAYPFRFSHQQGNKQPTNAHSTGKNHQQDSHTTANTAAASSTGSSFWSQKIIGYHVKEKDALSTGRIILLRWWRVLMSNAQQVPYAERCIYLECVLEIMSRAEFVEFDHSGSPSSTFDDWIAKSDDTILNEYRSLLSLTLRYAIGKLNQKAIYSNMILFCSKVLALCFFKVPGLAPALLRILPVKAQLTRRIRQELGDITADCSRYRPILSGAFSAHLHPLMVTDARSYQSAFRQAKSRLCPPITFAGNWIRRWQSDDSELFFFFYRHYHSTLKLYVKGAYPHVEQCTSIQRNALLSLSPGYMYLAAYFAGKIDALLHREIHSVTTVLHCSQQNANSAGSATNSEWHNRPATASGNKSMPNDPDMMTVVNKPLISTPTSTTTPAIIANGDNHAQHQQQRMARNPSKPRPLDAATHKYAECMAFCVTMADPQGLYYNMVNIWLRAVVKRTNFMVAESVFCLLDFIEVLILEMQCCQGNPKEGPFLDLPFLLDTLNILLTKSDHTISLLRALSFIYIHFPYLTSRTVLMETLCRQMLLSPPIFEKLLLHWNRNVRIFFLRCLFWRVARVYSPRSVRWTNSDTDHDTCDGQSCRQEWQNLSSGHAAQPKRPGDAYSS